MLVLGLLSFISCRSDKPEIKPQVPVVVLPGKDVFIINEGNYQWGNASLSFYESFKGTVREDVFRSENQRSLGDVCQSMEIFNGKAYIVVNNSNKIEIVDPVSFRSLGKIQGLRAPRYFLGVSKSRAYVTDLYSNAVSVIDLNSNTRIKDIPCAGWTEEMVLSQGKVFVTNLRKEYLFVIDTATDALEDSIKVGASPNSIQEDKNGKLWVLCGGNSSKNVAGSLHKIDPATKQVELSLSFGDVTDGPGSLDMNGTKDTLYFLKQGVYRMAIANAVLPSAPLIRQNDFLFYGLGIDPLTGVIYVSDAVDYVQKGKIFRYSPAGTLIGKFEAGIIPSDFYFY